jgi:hypothetical protein
MTSAGSSPLSPATESGLCVLEPPNQAPVLAVSTLFSTSHNEKGELIGPTLNIVPLSDKLTAVVLSCPAEFEDSVGLGFGALPHVGRGSASNFERRRDMQVRIFIPPQLAAELARARWPIYVDTPGKAATEWVSVFDQKLAA